MSEPQGRLWPGWLTPALIVAAATLPFLPGIASPFVQWDDLYYVVNSQGNRVPGWKGLLAQWDVIQALEWRRIEWFPLRDSVYWALVQVFGFNPVPFHVTNLAFHALTSVLVWRLGLRLGLTPWVSAVGGLLFAVHPVHVESVVWISALKDPLFLSAMLGSFICYLRYRETKRPLDYGLSLLLLMASLASKSLALPTVLLMVVAERLFGAPTPWRLIAARTVGPLVITAVSFAHILAVGRDNNVITGPHGGSWASHWVLMSWASVRYVQQALLPFEFRLHYCFTPAAGVSDPRLWAAVAVLAAVAVGCVFAFRANRTLGFLCLWFLACLGPVANILPFPALLADRYLYAPTVGTVLLTAWLLDKARLRTVLAAAALVVLSAAALARSVTWQHEWQLWDEVAADEACWKDPSLITLNVLLIWGTSQPEPQFAIDAFKKVLDSARWRSDVRFERVTCERFSTSVLRNRVENPELELRAAEVGVMLCPIRAEAWERLARANWKRRPDIASRALEKAFAADPISFRRWQLGIGRANAGDHQRAKEDIAGALAWEPAAICPSFQRWLEALPADQQATYQPLRASCP